MKKKPQPQHPLSPAKYIQLKGRSLPIASCHINSDWQEAGMANIIVVRKHQSGNFTIGHYLVDTFCLGVKDTIYQFSITVEELERLTDQMPFCTAISYNEVHNIIYGALDFAQEEAGIAPHSYFELTQYLLEEDTDEIPLIEYEFGKDGKPFLAVQTRLEASKYLSKLQQRYGKDFAYLIREDEEEKYDEYEDWEKKEEEEEDLFSNLDPAFTKKMLKNLEKMKRNYEKTAALTHTTYAYAYPEYPATLELMHSELKAVYNMDFFYALPREVIQQLLALPRETLIADLNQIILYELGKSYKVITDEKRNKYANTLTHILFLLGELKATESLQAVLEILRQDDASIDFHFGDTCLEILRPTLYYIARNQTGALLAFMKEPGLDLFARSYILPVLTTIAANEPERREEVIDWFRQLLRFLNANVTDSSVYDATLAGILLSELLDIHATELLPEIKKLYDTGQVDFMCCGKYPEVEKEMLEDLESITDYPYPLPDIYQRYQDYEEEWKP